jgi:hypothetical protein
VNDFLNRIKDLADEHDDKVDSALEKVGEQIDERTGNKYSDHIDRAVDAAQEHTGDGNTQR